MKASIYKLSLLLVVILFCYGNSFAQTHIDPPFLQIVSAENAITLDGKLDETDWARRFDYLIFKAGYKGGDVQYGVTSDLDVDSTLIDTTTTQVKILHNGLDLYISLQSDDKYVSKWGGSWEGDGMFMKLASANGIMYEFKLYFNASGTDPEMVFETGAPAGSAEAMGYKMPGTIVNDTTSADSGYTAELIIHLDQLGYTDQYAEVPVLINIFDPDKQTGTSGEEYKVGSYYKSWWGSEWGPTTRTLRLADPKIKVANKTADTIVLDGKLDENLWQNADYVVVGKGSGSSTGGYYSQWSDTNNTYEDQSMATVKFMHNGTDLYIGVESDDKSVCAWSSGWEADGLFLWMTNKGEMPPATRMEIKNMFFTQTIGAGADFQTSSSVPTGSAEGACYLPAGTVTHTETGGEDAGYSLEVVIHTDYYGYTVGDTVNLSVCMWDIDKADAVSYNADVSDYAPNWWGTQWCDPNFEKYFMYRGVVLSNSTDVEQTDNLMPSNYKLDQNYPNPFNPSTKISYSLPQSGNVSLVIYDVLGNKIEELVKKEQAAGNYVAEWNASKVASGVYFYTLKAGNYIQSKKMLLVK
jgi:hypothetical protein